MASKLVLSKQTVPLPRPGFFFFFCKPAPLTAYAFRSNFTRHKKRVGVGVCVCVCVFGVEEGFMCVCNVGSWCLVWEGVVRVRAPFLRFGTRTTQSAGLKARRAHTNNPLLHQTPRTHITHTHKPLFHTKHTHTHTHPYTHPFLVPSEVGSKCIGSKWGRNTDAKKKKHFSILALQPVFKST
jgi:hypothetical protein